ncbi:MULTISPECIES: trehalose-phosphatase [unclassified Psychrobacter]|uniref:trehalose-phosphatase n=1 Tax=unclassified Psychrobacter TaxID=196806 RepID=UPI0025D79279|nr:MULTISPECIES: trehalose-phosphatase [unclassified Psychrobacter]
MTSGRSCKANSVPIYITPNHFVDYLSHQQRYCLFLDIDGTLADFTLNPKDSFIPPATLTLLRNIQNHGIKVVAVSGRSLTEAKQMLSPLTLSIAATHGLEIAFDDDNTQDNDGSSVSSVDTHELAAIRQAIIESCTSYDDFIIEDKPYSVALHYRQNPALADAAYDIVAATLKNHTNWILKKGKYVWEIAPKGADKGSAILTLLKRMQSSNTLCPIFIGDDITDEAGFMAVQGDDGLNEKHHLIGHSAPKENPHRPIKGIGIKVGYDPNEPTCAHYYVNDIFEVTVLLESFLKFCQQRPTSSSDLFGLSDTDSKNK